MNGLHPCTLSQQAPFAAVRRVSPLCAVFCPDRKCVRDGATKAHVAPTCAKKHKIAIQQRDCDFERRRSGMDETCRLRRGEGYGACADEGASIAFG